MLGVQGDNNVDVKNFTYNEISFMAFGEAISAKRAIDVMVQENKELKEEVERYRKLIEDDGK